MRRITFLFCIMFSISLTMSAQSSLSDTERELQQAASVQTSESQVPIQDLVARYENLGNQINSIKDHFTANELQRLRGHLNSAYRGALAAIIPNAGATETFPVVVGDFFYDPTDGTNGGPGGDCSTTSSGDLGDYPNCGCTTVTTLTGTDLSVEFLSFNIFGNFDVLNIYDGPDTSSPQIYDSNLNTNTDTLAGLIAANGSAVFDSTSDALTFEFSATAVVNTCGWEVEVIAGGGGGGGACAMPLLEVNQDVEDTCMAFVTQTDLAQSYIAVEPQSAGAGIKFTAGTPPDGLDVTLSLWDALPNAGGTMLATGTTTGTTDEWVDVFWDPVVTLTPGDTYFITIEGDAALPCVAGSTGDPYAGGDTYANTGYTQFPGFDYTFRTYSCGSTPPPMSGLAYGPENVNGDYGSFDLMAPTNFTVIGPNSGTVNFEGAGAADPANPGTAYAIDNVGDAWSVDLVTGVYTSLGNVGLADITGLEFDPLSGTLYAITSLNLHTVDIGALSTALVGPLGTAGGAGIAVSFAIDGAGVGYVFDIVDDNMYSVDLGTGAATLLGAAGFDGNFGQGMFYDGASDTVFLSAFNATVFESQLRSLDTASGATTLVDGILSGALAQVAWATTENAPPVDNDDCANATAVACGETVLGDTSDNTDQGGNNDSLDEWFKFTGTGASQFVTVSLCDGGTSYDSRLTVYDSCGGTEIVTNDDSCGLQSEVSFVSDGTTTYYIAVEGFNAAANGAFSLAITCTDVAENDECADAIAMSCGETVIGSTEFATIDSGATDCGVGITSPGVWYTFTDTTGLLTNYTVSLCDGGTAYDSKLTVYSGTDCAALTCVGDNDDSCGLQSEVAFQGDGSTTYYILVHGFGGATGEFSLNLTCEGVPPPNDMIANSIDVDQIGFPYTDPNVAMPFATTEAGTPAGCDNAGVKGVWYNFVPEGNGTATATIITPAGPSSVTFYTAPNETAVETDLVHINSQMNQCVAGVQATINTTAGQAYYVYVANHGGATDIMIDGVNLGADDNTIEGFGFYPNPANETINLTAADTIESIELFSIIGQRVMSQTINATSTELNVSDLSTGTYLMKVIVNGQLGVYKVIKE